MEVTRDPALVYCPHPLLPTAGRRLVDDPFRPGETIADYLERQGLAFGAQPVVLRLNDRIIPRARWGEVCPRSGDMISVRATVHGGGGSNPLRIVLMIAVLVAAVYLGPLVGNMALGGANLGVSVGVQTAVGTAIVATAGNLLVNAIAPLPRPKLASLQSQQDSPTYSISGGSNRLRPYQPLPLVLGRHRVFPDLAAQTYTEFEGADQILFQVFNFGITDVVLSDIRIGETPITDYQDVELQESDVNGVIDLFPGNVDTEAGGQLVAADGWMTRTGSVDATALAVEIAGSLLYAGDEGPVNSSVDIAIQYRRVGVATWSNLTYVGGGGTVVSPAVGTVYHLIDGLVANAEAGQAVRITNGSTKPVRRTYKWRVSSGQYEVRVKRVTPDATDSRTTSDMYWSQLRTYQPDPADYRGQKRLAVRIKASGQLQGVISQLSAVAEARIPVWTGVNWITQTSRNPAWQFLYLARGKFDASGRRVFGGGLSDIRIDIEAIKEWGAWCAAKGLTCSVVFDQVMTVAEQLVIVARCGRAAPTFASGKLGVIYDQAALPVTAVFGMSNIIRNTFSVEYITEKLADEIVLQFINPAKNYTPDTVRALVPGVTNPVSQAFVELFGCDDAEMAGKEANLLAAAHIHRVRRVSWEADFEGLAVDRGDVVSMSHDLTQWGASGRLVSGTATELVLDRAVTFTPGLAHYIGLRAPDGTYDIYDVVYSIDETDTITLTTPLPSAPDDDPDHPACDWTWSFEPKATPGKKLKITGVKPLSESRVRISATDETDDYYLAESNSYTYTPNLPASRLPALADLEVTEQLVRAGSGYVTIITLTWNVTGEYGGAIVRAGLNGAPREQVGQTAERRVEFTTQPGGVLSLEVVGFNLRGQYGPQSRLETTYNIQGKTLTPPDVTTFLVQRQPDGTREFSWELANPPPDLLGYQIRYVLGSSGVWESMTPMHKGVLTASPFESNQLAAGTYTFAIKAIDTAGLESVNARYISLAIGDPRMAGVIEYVNLVEEGWSGTKTNCYVDSDGTLIANDNGTWNDLPTTWDAWQSWTIDPAGAIEYLHEIDIGAVVTFLPLVTFTAFGAQILENQYSADNVVWSAWEPIGPAVTARYYRVRLAVSGAFPRVTSGSIILAADPIIEDVDDLDTSTLTGAQRIGVGDVRIPLQRSFTFIKTVSVTLQNVGAGWSWELIDKQVADGPRIRIYNASDVLADAVIDVTVKGV